MADETPNDDQAPEETPAEATPAAEETPVETGSAPQPTPVEGEEPAAAPAAPEAPEAAAEEDDEEFVEETPRVKPAIPGADLEVDIVSEGQDPLGRESVYDEDYDPDADTEASTDEDDDELIDDQPIAATIELAADARYRATGKRKTAIARVTLKPGTGNYVINGRTLDEFFPRDTLRRTIRQPLEAVAYETRMDVVCRIHGGGVAAQAGALRHGISRALLEADPNLRGELKRRGFLTRDSRVKERKKAGLKKARKRPQFSKR
jgi:small subunit ribosomal protein S9